MGRVANRQNQALETNSPPKRRRFCVKMQFMKKLSIILATILVLGGVGYFAYTTFFIPHVVVINVAMPNVSYKYSNLPSDTSVVFFNNDTGNWYADGHRIGSGSVTVMVPPGMPNGTYSMQLIDSKTGKKMTNNRESFVVGLGAPPAATIDQSSLNTSTHNPIISGVAQNVYDVAILVEDANFRRYFGSEADVSPENGGKWAIVVENIPNGTYSVKVFNSRGTGEDVLARGTLTVSAD